jgi:broad specificity phosphatase PhoE
VVHSGLIRTRLLAERIAIVAGCRLEEDTAWRERSFGAWEGLSWNAIYRSTGSAMDGMIDAPDHFRPGGGETTSELARRAALAWDSLPRGSGIVVTHGGPIAALLGRQRDLPPMAWPGLIPLPGSVVDICR